MSRTVTVGLDGSRESRAAAGWAAVEAELRAVPLKLVQVWEPLPKSMAKAPSSVPRHTGTGPRGSRARPPRNSAYGTPLSTSVLNSSPAAAPPSR